MAFDLRPPGDDEDVVGEINMTPLVDVMLVLLIIFMVTMPVMTHSVRVELPKATSSVNEVRPQTIVLAVTRDAALRWNGEPIAFDEMERRLAAAATAGAPQPEIQIGGDNAVGYGDVLRVMAAVQRSGLRKIGFLSEPVR